MLLSTINKVVKIEYLFPLFKLQLFTQQQILFLLMSKAEGTEQTN